MQKRHVYYHGCQGRKLQRKNFISIRRKIDKEELLLMKVLRPGETGQHCLPNTIVCFSVISYGQSTHVAIWTRTMMFS